MMSNDPFSEFLGKGDSDAPNDDDEICGDLDDLCPRCLAAVALLRQLEALEGDDRRVAVSKAFIVVAARHHLQGFGEALCAVTTWAGQGLEIVDSALKSMEEEEGA